MRTTRLALPILATLILFAACKTRGTDKTTGTPSATPAASSVASAPSASASVTPKASAAASADLAPSKYPTCESQGANAKQLAPAFLEKMKDCEKGDIDPVAKLSELAGGDGKLADDKGGCHYAKDISCHFHTSMEFVSSKKLKDDDKMVGEMHCIVPPGSGPKSPTVYGAHLRCKPGTAPGKGAKVCSKELIKVIESAQCKAGWKCCDKGTLTKPVGKQSATQLTLRPDFRICSEESIAIDCGLLKDSHGHTANVAGVGEEYSGKFAPDDHAKDKGKDKPKPAKDDHDDHHDDDHHDDVDD